MAVFDLQRGIYIINKNIKLKNLGTLISNVSSFLYKNFKYYIFKKLFKLKMFELIENFNI